MITFATYEMRPFLESIWKECFGDTDSYIQFYFNHRFREDNTLVWLEEGKPVSMLAMFPAALFTGDREIPIRYIYGVSTKKAWRGRKIASQLLQYGEELIGEPFVLVPATDSLFSYYKKLGYKTAFQVKEKRVESRCSHLNLKEDVLFSSIEKEEYYKLRNHYFYREGYVKWDLKALSYGIEENKLIGGMTWKITYQGKNYAALGYVKDKILYITEIAIEDAAVEEVIFALLKNTNCIEAKIRLPINSSLEGNPKNFAMMKGIDITTKGYFNLGKD